MLPEDPRVEELASSKSDFESLSSDACCGCCELLEASVVEEAMEAAAAAGPRVGRRCVWVQAEEDDCDS